MIWNFECDPCGGFGQERIHNQQRGLNFHAQCVIRRYIELLIFTMFVIVQAIRHYFFQCFGNKYKQLTESSLTRSLRLPIHC